MKFNIIKEKTILFKLIYTCFIISTFVAFFYFISESNNKNIIPYSSLEKPLEDTLSANVGAFITDNTMNNTEELNKFFTKFFETRNNSFLTGNVVNLYNFYDTSQTYSKYSLLHEFKRIAYLRDWASERNIQFSSINSSVNIDEVKPSGDNYHITLVEEYKFEYEYKDNPEMKNDFGISLYHNIDLKKINDNYIIIKDYYLDCFEDGLDSYNFNLNEKEIPLTKGKTYNLNFNIQNDNNHNDTSKNGVYDREAAVNYANDNCGISWVNNDNNTNEYYSYISSCGDCANFVSQCLGDKDQGGKLPQDKTWNYTDNGEDIPTVSESWVSPKKLVNYLISAEKVTISTRGNFNNLYKAGYFTSSAFASIKKGDLISYKINNEIEHTAIITDFDSKGYPLINSNSINKYKVPFDLGWSNTDVSFDFIKVKTE